MEVTIVIVVILLALYLWTELRRIETRLCGADDRAHDSYVDARVAEATQSYTSHRNKLEQEKKALPGIDLWAINSTPDWQQQLVAKAEALRPLAEEAYGYSPDTPHFMHRLGQIPMTYNLAHALAAFATLRMDIAIKKVEWTIKRIEVLGLTRKRNARLEEIAEVDRDLKELEQETAALESQIESKRNAVCDAVFEKMRDAPPE